MGLALGGGGFDVSTRHIAGLAVWLVVVALLVLGTGARTALARPFYWAVGLIGGLALLCALSSLWSGSVELSVVEADRVLVYLGVFVAAFLVAQTNKRRQRFAEGIAIGIAIVGLMALGSRLLPQLIDIGGAINDGPRLRYPLGYWNANGAIFGIGVGMLLWMSRASTWRILRWASVGLMPALLLALYLTYSRGGLLALAIAAGCLIVLSRDRLWKLATLGAVALGALPAVLAVQGRRDLAENVPGQAAVDQGNTVLAILLAGVVLALLLYAGLRWAEGREGRLTGRAVAISRNPAVLRGVAVAIALVAIGVVIAVGGRAWDQFTESDVQVPNQAPEERLPNLSGSNRADFYRVALDSFAERPFLGSGAGTYQFSWDSHRSVEQPVQDAHSLYLESFAELGIVGGLVVLALVGGLLWTGASAWRASRPAQRDLHAVLLAAALAFAVGAGIDWLWETPALGSVFFLAAGALVAARCRQLSPLATGEREKGEQRPFGLAVAGLATAWIAAVALVGPLLVDRELSASQAAAGGENYESAVSHANTARSIEPFAATPYVQLGLLAEVQGDYGTADEMLTQAINREKRNWQLYYLRSRVELEAGDETAARADYERARKLNPLKGCLEDFPPDECR